MDSNIIWWSTHIFLWTSIFMRYFFMKHNEANFLTASIESRGTCVFPQNLQSWTALLNIILNFQKFLSVEPLNTIVNFLILGLKKMMETCLTWKREKCHIRFDALIDMIITGAIKEFWDFEDLDLDWGKIYLLSNFLYSKSINSVAPTSNLLNKNEKTPLEIVRLKCFVSGQISPDIADQDQFFFHL